MTIGHCTLANGDYKVGAYLVENKFASQLSDILQHFSPMVLLLIYHTSQLLLLVTSRLSRIQVKCLSLSKNPSTSNGN